MNKQQLAAKIWESANKMRSKIEANEYKDYILGFIFYKYLSDKEVLFARKEGMTDVDLTSLTEEDSETVAYFQENNGYFIAHEHLFSTWIAKGSDFNISDVRDALSAFNRLIDENHKKLFDGVLDTLQTGLSKLGENAAAQTKAASDLIYLINDIPMSGKQDYDVLGFIYEYLIGMFAANAGKKAGEFYTPHEVSLLMSEIIAHHTKGRSEIKIYDPTSGSGSLLINIGHSVAKHIDHENPIKYYAQELKQNTYNLTRMNLIMRDILPSNIVTRNGDTLEDDWPYFDESDPTSTYNPLYVDAVVSNPPYSQHWEPDHKDSDPRYARFGLAPKTKADYAFLLHDLYHLKPDGIMTIVLPHGVLFRGGEEGAIRKNLIEFNHVDTIIGLPSNIFFGTGIPTIIMVLKQRRDHNDVLIVDASKNFIKVGKNNKLRASDIKCITDAIVNRQTIQNFAQLVSKDTIRNNDYNLNIPRYVDTSDKAETWDIYASMFGGIPNSEVDELANEWQAFAHLRASLFTNTTEAYTTLAVSDVNAAVLAHDDVTQFTAQFNNAFASFKDFLKTRLIGDVTSVSLQKELDCLADDVFARLQGIALIDRYEAYQLLDDHWTLISGDIEIIQSEGWHATKQVDANMVIKKQKGKDVEVQEGWLGRIMPFDLVQTTYLAEELAALKAQENRLLEIAAELDALLESLSEEEKEQDTVNDNKDAFVTAEVTKAVNRIKADQKAGEVYEAESYELKLLQVADLLAEQKVLKASVKADSIALHLRTKETIENLSDEQVNTLLELKWISPLVTALHQLPNNVIHRLITRVQALSEKYAVTYSQLTTEIEQTENALADLLGELEGNAFDMQGLSEFQSLLKGL